MSGGPGSSPCDNPFIAEHDHSIRPPGWLPPAGMPTPGPASTPAPIPTPASELRAPAPAPGPEPSSGSDEPHKRRGLGGVLVALAAIAAKGKAVLLLLPKIKLLTTSGSMLVSIGAYTLIWGWKFAVGFVVLLFVHEMGHVIQLRREGIEASAPVFIPFLGAVVWAKSLGGNALAEARVGLAGPILGSLGAAALIPIADASGNELWRALAFTGFFLNLFNLLPVVPLDGGRAMAALSPWMWFVGFFAIVVLAFLLPNPIIILIALVAGFDLYKRWKQRKEGGEEMQTYYRVSPRHRVIVAAVYFGLIALLVLGMDATHVQRTFSDAWSRCEPVGSGREGRSRMRPRSVRSVHLLPWDITGHADLRNVYEAGTLGAAFIQRHWDAVALDVWALKAELKQMGRTLANWLRIGLLIFKGLIKCKIYI